MNQIWIHVQREREREREREEWGEGDRHYQRGTKFE